MEVQKPAFDQTGPQSSQGSSSGLQPSSSAAQSPQTTQSSQGSSSFSQPSQAPQSEQPQSQQPFQSQAPQSAQAPQVEPCYVSFETGRPYHVHKSYIWVGPLMAVAVVVFAILVSGIDEFIDLYFAIQHGYLQIDLPLIILICVGLLVIVIGAFIGLYALAWKYMTYVFDQREFSFYSGILVKKRVHVPYERVQSVNHRASLVQRLFGVCTVVIDSAGGAANKGVRVPYVRLSTAERMRNDIFVRKAAAAAGIPVVYAPQYDAELLAQAGKASRQAASGQAPVPPGVSSGFGIVPPQSQSSQPLQGHSTSWSAGQPQPTQASMQPGVVSTSQTQAPNILDDALGAVGQWRGLYGGAGFAEEPVSYSYGLKNSELILASLSHPGPLAGALITGFCLLFIVAFGIFAGDAFSVILAALAAPIAIGAILLIWIFGSAGIVLGYGGFKVRRRGSRIEVERGLITRNFSGIDIQRVQSIEIRQSLLRRLLGYCELSLGRIDAASQENSQSNNSSATKGLVIHPFVKLSAVDNLLSGLLPEFDDRPRVAEEKKLPRPALRRAILRNCLWYNWVLWALLIFAVVWGGIALLGTGESMVSSEDLEYYTIFLQGFFTVLIAVLIACTALFATSAVLWAKKSGYIWNRRFLMLHRDGITTHTSIIPRQKLQCGYTRSNPFQRRLDLTSIIAVTAAGTSHTTLRLLDVTAEDGDAYLGWLR